MAQRCSHMQCGAPATARVAFDSLACFVWIDPFEADGPRDVGARGAGALCTRHADRLVPPRGWAVQDRRGAEPPLWSERPPIDVADRPTRTTRRDRSPVEQLDFEVVDAPLPFEHAPARVPMVETAARTVGTGERGRDEIEALLAAPTSPLLSRAFNPARGSPARRNPSHRNELRTGHTG